MYEKKRWDEVITSTNILSTPRQCEPSCTSFSHLANGTGNMHYTSKCPILSPATEGDTSMVYPIGKEESTVTENE